MGKTRDLFKRIRDTKGTFLTLVASLNFTSLFHLLLPIFISRIMLGHRQFGGSKGRGSQLNEKSWQAPTSRQTGSKSLQGLQGAQALIPDGVKSARPREVPVITYFSGFDCHAPQQENKAFSQNLSPSCPVL